MLEPLLELDPELALPDGTRLADALAALGPGQRVEQSAHARLDGAGWRWRRSGSSQAGGNTGGASPGKSGIDAQRLSRPPGGPRSPAGGRRRSSPGATLAAIWRSAAFGGSPPSTPSAIQSSIRCSQPGSAARSAADRLVVGLFIGLANATIGAAVLTARPIGTPSRAPSA